MHHFFDAITDNKGNALTGYYVRVTDSSGVGQTLYADASLTPIISVSGLADAAQVDGNGNVDFYVNVGTYTVNIYATDGTTLVHSVVDVPMLVDTSGLYGAVGELVQVGSRSALGAITPAANLVRYLTESGREGTFVFDSTNNAANVTADPNQGVYVAPSSDTTGASGAWVRKFDGCWKPEWFGAGGGDSTDDQAAFSGINSLSAAVGYLHLELEPNGTYIVNHQIQNTGGFYQQGVNGIDATNLSSVVIRGNGATLKTNPGLKFGCFDPGTGAVVNYTTASPAPNSAKADIGYAINVDTCALVSIRDVILDGNAASHTIGGTTTTGDTETKHYGLREVNNAQVTVENVKVSNFLTDNLVTHDIALVETDTPRPHSYRNCVFDTAGRNSVSWTGGIGYTFDTCIFRGGASVIVAGGGFLKSAPGSAFDVEAEIGICRKGRWTNCTFDQGVNGVTCMTAGSGDTKDLVFDHCKLIGQVFAHQPRMIFEKCRVYGYFGSTYGSTDPNLATQINNCWVTDATSGSTPQLAPAGNLVMGAAGTGTTISRTTFDLSFTLGNPQGCNTYNCTYILRHNTTTLASGSTVMTLGAGIYNENLTIIDSITSNAPASPYNISIGVTTVRNGNLVSATPNIKWLASGATGFTGKFDNAAGTQLGVTVDTAASGTVTLYPRASKRTYLFDAAFAADRIVTLSTISAVDGDEWDVIRSANATGAFNANIGTGPLKALSAASTGARFRYSSTAAAWKPVASWTV